MIWTRRTFLQTLLAGVAASTALSFDPPIPEIAPGIDPSQVVFDPEQRFWVYDIIAGLEHPTDTTEIQELRLTRNGQFVLRAAFHPKTTFRWVACPGGELVGQGLVNQSTADLQIVMMVEQNGYHYCFRDNTYVSLESLPAEYAPDEEVL